MQTSQEDAATAGEVAVGRGVRISVNTLSMRLILTRQPFAEYCNFPPGIPRGSVVKNPPAMQRCRRYGFTPWVGKIPWLRKWQPTPVFFTWEIPWTVEPGTLVVHGITKSQTPLRIHAGTWSLLRPESTPSTESPILLSLQLCLPGICSQPGSLDLRT